MQMQRRKENVKDDMFDEMPLRERDGGEKKRRESGRDSMNPNM